MSGCVLDTDVVIAALDRQDSHHAAAAVSLADGFALATAQAERASVATFDRRVRRALPKLGLELASRLT